MAATTTSVHGDHATDTIAATAAAPAVHVRDAVAPAVDTAPDSLTVDAAAEADAAAVAATAAATSAATAVSATSWTDTSTRERIAGSPLVPDCVKWADDGRVAVVSDASVMISTFMSRELEMYIQQGPAISKSYIFVPESTANEHVPITIPVFNESTESAVPTGSMTHFLLYEGDRHQHNPKELSLSKNDGNALVAATWGPRGSGPNASCALVTLSSASRMALHFASSFRIRWHEADVFSETLFAFMASVGFDLRRSKKRRRTSDDAAATTSDNASTQSLPPTAAAPTTVADYAHRCSMLATLTVAWSQFVHAPSSSITTTSLLAFAGRKVATIWHFARPSFVASDPAPVKPYLSHAPVAWIDTEAHGWVTTSAWQQLRVSHSAQATHATLTLVLGTTAGNVLLARVPVSSSSSVPSEVALDRVLQAPHRQPVFSICFGARATTTTTTTHLESNALRNDLVVASGSTISVWNVQDDHHHPPRRTSWRAHDGNVTGLGVSYFGNSVFTSGADGRLRCWDTASGIEQPFRSTNGAANATNDPSSKYPLFGLAVSPSAAQIACVHIIPPAARPNRKSQADTSYSRVSSALEYVAAPAARDAAGFAAAMCRVLDDDGNATASLASPFLDVLWFCSEDNAAITSLHGSADLTIPHLLDKLKGVSRTRGSGGQSRQPLYLTLCETLERKFADATHSANGDEVPASAAAIRYLQASYLLRSCIVPAEHHVAVRDVALATLRRTLLCYWAERCLTALVAQSTDCVAARHLSDTECLSALLMADVLSVQTPLNAARTELVTHVYTQLDAADNAARWRAYSQRCVDNAAASGGGADATERTDESRPTATPPPLPPSRQLCFICNEAVPFSESTFVCASGHAQERCFLSFRVLASLDAWRCLGCGASACALDDDDASASATLPFYLLAASSQRLRQEDPIAVATAVATHTNSEITCRLCGNYCSFFTY